MSHISSLLVVRRPSIGAAVAPVNEKHDWLEVLQNAIEEWNVLIVKIDWRRAEMFVAMNRFKVIRGQEASFEQIWAARRTRLDEMPGFMSFHLLRGPEQEDHTLYASHTMWATKEAFLAWTRSEQFRDSHKDAGKNKPLYIGPPQFEGFESVLGESTPHAPGDRA